MKDNYSSMSNYNYCYRMWKLYGDKLFKLRIVLQVLLEVVYPYLICALPSIVVGLLTSNLKVEKILCNAIIIVFLIQGLHVALTYLKSRNTESLFFFRINIITEFFQAILTVDYLFLESEEGKRLKEKGLRAIYTGNEQGIESFVREGFNLISNILGLTVYILVSGSLNIWIVVLLLITSVCSMMLQWRTRILIQRKEEEEVKYYEKRRYLGKQTISTENGKDIRLYGMKHWLLDSYQEINNQVWRLDKRMKKKEYFFRIIDLALSLVRDGIIYTYLFHQMTEGMAIDRFLLYVGITAGFSGWMKKAIDAYTHLSRDSVMVSDFRRYIEHGNKELMKSYTLEKSIPREIRLENVSFSFPNSDVMVLHNINLTIKKGERLGIVGMNGAGKSTLIKLICGLYAPTEGVIYLDGVDIRTIEKKKYFGEIAAVFQDVFAFAFSIEENITCMLENNTNKEKLDMVLSQAGLLDKVNSLDKKEKTSLLKNLDPSGIELSGGQLQRLMLSRALYKNSNILILDEPTAALDPIAESELYEKYLEFTTGKTSIFISHRLSSTKFCDRLIFLENGCITEEGSHEVLMCSGGAYAKMYQVQSHYYTEEENVNHMVDDVIEEDNHMTDDVIEDDNYMSDEQWEEAIYEG